MHRRIFTPLVLLMTLTNCTDDVACPAGAKRVEGVCTEGSASTSTDLDSSVLPGDEDDDGDKDGGEISSPDAMPVNPVADSGTPAADAGEPDATIPAQCFLDVDNDGVGAGDAVDCAATEAAGKPLKVVDKSGDCDDDDPRRAPMKKELCDGIDNDCDDEADEGAKNACGGACTRLFEHQPGELCTNGLLGACAREGTYSCQSDSAVACTAPNVNPSSELCGDSKDNDCDGVVDEADPDGNAPLWYQDCDGDGFAASTTGAQKACTQPAKAGACSWTSVIPNPATKTNWDCDDSSTAYSPSVMDYQVPTGRFTRWDFNCDGEPTPAPAPFPAVTDVCNSTMIARLNAGNTPCESDSRWNNCLVWKDAAGKFTATPPAKCPDTSTHRVAVFIQLGNPTLGIPGGWTCTVAAVDPIWPCR